MKITLYIIINTYRFEYEILKNISNFSFMLYTFPVLKIEKNDKLFQEYQSIPNEFAFIHVP